MTLTKMILEKGWLLVDMGRRRHGKTLFVLATKEVSPNVDYMFSLPSCLSTCMVVVGNARGGDGGVG